MERYTIVAPSGSSGTVSILVPCERQAKVQDLINKARGRLERASAAINGRQLLLKLGAVDGPLLDGDDALEHVVLNPSRERLFVSFAGTNIYPTDLLEQMLQSYSYQPSRGGI